MDTRISLYTIIVLKNVTISSTKIREALLQADIVTANEFLGYDYFFSGKVIKGNKLGRTIGYPTANLQIGDEHKLVPGNGVYAVAVELKAGAANRKLQGMMNIGVRPTVDGTKRMIEVNLFDFDEDIYGQTMKVTLENTDKIVEFNGLPARIWEGHTASGIAVHAYITRIAVKNGLEALKSQLSLDKQNAIAALGS